MGAENAAAFAPSEEDAENNEVSKLAYIDISTVDNITEFYELCLTQKIITEGMLHTPVTYLKAFGEASANNVDKVTNHLS